MKHLRDFLPDAGRQVEVRILVMVLINDHSDLQSCSRYGINHKSFFYQLLLWKQAIQLKQKQKLEYWTDTLQVASENFTQNIG